MYKVIWLTGLPCSGKTTIGRKLAEYINAEFLDGDELRSSIFSRGAGFTREERDRHLLSAGYMAKRLSKYAHVVCSFVSPNEATRKQLPIDVLVHVDCPLEVCEKRDVKGMYAKARRGEIRGFTGIEDPYESPENPDIVVHTDKMETDECVAIIASAV